MYANKRLMLNCDLYNNTWNYLTLCKKYKIKLILKFYQQNGYKSHLIYVYKQDLALNNLQ